MSANYSFVGEINRNNAMGAVADTMNSLNLDILKATMEMGGKQVVEKDGKAYALERLDDSEVKELKDKVTSQTFYTVNGDVNCTKSPNTGQYFDSNGAAITAITVDSKVYTWVAAEGKYKNITTPAVTAVAGVAAHAAIAADVAAAAAENPPRTIVLGSNVPAVSAVTAVAEVSTTLPASAIAVKTTYSSTQITNTDTAMAIFDILGINPSSDIDGGIDGNNWKISMVTDGDSVTMKVAFVDKNTGDTMIMGVRLDDDGSCIGLSALQNKASSTLEAAIDSTDLVITDVDGGGLLESWGISNPEELQPGDLFLVQQKLQIIKDTVSAVHTTGKTQGDIMREATQKFAQG